MIIAGIILIQILFVIYAVKYFVYLNENANQSKIEKSKKYVKSKKDNQDEYKDELEKINELRKIKLTEPLAEKTRPKCLEEIVGQEDGIKALKAAICGENPQHVIIYGPPGVGKTAVARIILEEAKKNKDSPFLEDAKFVEIDATTLQFDERSIADPLIGSVHDPIYQGSGGLGQSGVPRPMPGAVTRAHGGILFIDEIAELADMQINKLLKVLEDRKVFLNSSYYSSDDKNTPDYIHDIFLKGFPADFRLIGATTSQPEEIAMAVRSRCSEIFFRDLKDYEIAKIAKNTFKRASMTYEKHVPEYISNYSNNARQAVNIVQTAVSLTNMEKRKKTTLKDIEWVIEFSRHSPKMACSISDEMEIGLAYGLGISGSRGFVLTIESLASYVGNKDGKLNITGIIEEEEMQARSGKLKRKSTANSSVLNVLTLVEKFLKIDLKDYNIHINFPGGIAVDGPSAGIAIFTSLYSAIKKKKINEKVAMTGEVSIKEKILAVGAVYGKIEAAKEAGIEKVIIPKSNYQSIFEKFEIDILAIESIEELIAELFEEDFTLEKEEGVQVLNDF